jgi:hypothetical protein
VWPGPAGAPDRDAFYPDALADAIRGSDHRPGDPDIVANFNSDYEDWYFGTDGNTPFGKSDFLTVVLHEIGHGLGFSGSAAVDGSGEGTWGIDDGSNLVPMAFDLFTETGDGTAVTDEGVFPNPSVELAEVLQGGDLFWDGSRAVTANGGPRPRLYSPVVWEPGSSYNHLDESTFPAGHPDSLMTPQLANAEANHDPGSLTLCVFEDMGWNTVEECSATYWVATAARASGVGGSQWRTSLGLFNRSDSTANIEIHYLRSNGQSASRTLSLAAKSQRVIADVVNFVGSSKTGSLRVVSNQPLIVGSRTFNQSANGTFGQYLDGGLTSGGASAGDSVWLAMLEESPDFRTNVGFTNTGSTDAKVTVTLFDSSGTELITFSSTMAAGVNKQDNQPYMNRAGRTDIRAGTRSPDLRVSDRPEDRRRHHDSRQGVSDAGFPDDSPIIDPRLAGARPSERGTRP